MTGVSMEESTRIDVFRTLLGPKQKLNCTSRQLEKSQWLKQVGNQQTDWHVKFEVTPCSGKLLSFVPGDSHTSIQLRRGRGQGWWSELVVRRRTASVASLCKGLVSGRLPLGRTE